MVRPPLVLLAGDFDDKNLYPQLKELLAKVDHDHSTHGNLFFYLATAPSFFGPIVEQLAASGLMEQDNHHWRRVIIEKPFGHDLESARALNQQLLQGRRRKADLSHRPLPGQRNRPEHHGVPLRQRNLRAHLEPPLHRSRADFRGGNRGRGTARQLLRHGRRAARHGAQPHHAAHQPDCDGAADFVPRRCGARRAGEDSACHPAPEFRRSAHSNGARAIRRRHSLAASTCPPIARKATFRPIPGPKPSSP